MPVVPALAEGAGQLEDLDEPPEPRVRGGSGRASLMKPLVVLALPGMYLFYKYSQYRREQRELSRRRVTERELQHLHHKIDKLLTKLEKNEPELASSQEDECVICVNARATMQTAPCGHRVVCRRCFVKTIQMAVSQRLLPLRCVICRAKILRLKQTLIPRDYSMSGKSWVLPQSASEYNMGTGVSVGVTGPGGRWVPGSVPASASLYSMASGSSSISGVSSVSSSSSSSASSTGSSNLGKPTRVRQPSGATLRRSQTQSMKMRIQEYQDPVQLGAEEEEVMRAGKASTRIRCAQKIVTQLETSPSPRDSSNVTSSTSATSTKSSSKRPPSAPKLSVVQEIQKSKKEKEREKEREKAEKARQKEEEKAEKTRQKEAKKLAKEEKKRAKKEAKARRKEAEEALLREEK
ncbi:PREDICTED: LOW QUALITY PROTEIN: serine/threonine-protein kinase 11-interacting protein [Eufriesea mexicana]|uniref:LOW QUALITY PROTEIN: serine/threonine-protein kinase 11-interacting protein n=1 Tax=Eufriesea mexicana TaxID=516756 RepID=UPI00083C131A|nr:PREDICTED: LOW QUALITY PROTEIN: serine/threonine-protein kinase 11-interacting protein [Eufriesea mexicana]